MHEKSLPSSCKERKDIIASKKFTFYIVLTNVNSGSQVSCLTFFFVHPIISSPLDSLMSIFGNLDTMLCFATLPLFTTPEENELGCLH